MNLFFAQFRSPPVPLRTARSAWIDPLGLAWRNCGCRLVLAASMITGCVTSVAHAPGDNNQVVTVISVTSQGYKRQSIPNGGFKAETYAFGEGGVQGGTEKDFSIDDMRFTDVAQVIAPRLAKMNYVPCDTSDPNHTDLLIMVYWGATIGTEGTSRSPEYQIAQSFQVSDLPPMPPAPDGTGGDPMINDPMTQGRENMGQVNAMLRDANNSSLQQSLLIATAANRQRDRQDRENAAILGYADEMNRTLRYKYTAFKSRHDDVISDVGESRYFVVLMAYDFQQLLHHKQKKLLWQTRFSIRQHHNEFSKQLTAMVESASRYFGHDSGGLKRRDLRDERVDLGDLKVIGVEGESK